MQDRLKFRIWYGPEKKMMLFNNPILLDGKVDSEDNGGLLFRNYDHNIKNVHECKPEDFKIMQCTGLKDKNGKLIYEGDIIKTKAFGRCTGHVNVADYVNFTVIYKEGCFMLSAPNQPQCVLRYIAENPKYFEIIGNEYENPELLEDK